MSLLSIVALILFGIFLVVIETFVFTGTLVAGVLGGILIVIGIFSSFLFLAPSTATAVLISSIIGTLAAMFFANKLISKRTFGLQTQLDGRVNEVDFLLVQTGDIGEAFGDLRLNGRAKINNEIFDVESTGAYIVSGTSIKVVLVTGSKIMVEAVENQQMPSSSEQGTESNE